jgi:hypothetical protein
MELTRRAFCKLMAAISICGFFPIPVWFSRANLDSLLPKSFFYI